jgi:hypothetical protein
MRNEPERVCSCGTVYTPRRISGHGYRARWTGCPKAATEKAERRKAKVARKAKEREVARGEAGCYNI